MDHTFCPGSRALRQPRPETRSCPSCGSEVEIWTDEVKGVCPGCARTVFKDGAMGCLDWCKYGEECVGTDIYATYRTNRAVGLKHRILEAMEKFFGADRPRIDHAKAVLDEAERLMVLEHADPYIVIPAAILHDIGIPAAEAKRGSAAPRYQEEEGPPVARKMLLAVGMTMAEIDEICAIVGHHHTPGVIDTASFRVVFDADCIVNGEESLRAGGQADARRLVGEVLLTPSGKARAEEVLAAAATIG
jgi:hypothetical protein